VPPAQPTLAPVPPAPFVAPSATPAAPAAPAPRAEATPELETGARAQLRVRADMIDRLVNEAGEVAIARSRVEGELRALKSNLLELTSSVIRLRGQMREIEIQAESQIQSQMQLQEQHGEFDPLEFDRYTRFQELTRSLAEGINDVSTVQQSLLKNLDDADAALLAQARLSRDVQQRLFSIRTVPFGSLSERLYRSCRATAKELDKRANLEIHGTQVELDRSVLEKLVGPLEHLLRNALDHGIESREARRNAGKSETGEIALTVRQVGNEVVIELADDGAGIDFARIRDRAVAQGVVEADATPTEAQLVECLFMPGFTTAARVTQISGRGIGMDVVRNEIAALAAASRWRRHWQGHALRADDAADTGGRAGGACARGRPPVGASCADGRAGAAGEIAGAARHSTSSARSFGRDARTRSTTCRGSWATPCTIRRRSATTRFCCCAAAKATRRSTSTKWSATRKSS